MSDLFKNTSNKSKLWAGMIQKGTEGANPRNIHSRVLETEQGSDLEAFAVDDGGTSFIVFLFADPHLLEGRQRRQDGAADPDGVLALWRGNDLSG